MLSRRRERFRNKGNNSKYSTSKDELPIANMSTRFACILKILYLQLQEEVLLYYNKRPLIIWGHQCMQAVALSICSINVEKYLLMGLKDILDSFPDSWKKIPYSVRIS